jgi:hypothetical protein
MHAALLEQPLSEGFPFEQRPATCASRMKRVTESSLRVGSVSSHLIAKRLSVTR